MTKEAKNKTEIELEIRFFTFFRDLLMSYSASVSFRNANGDEKAENLLDKVLAKILQILQKPDKTPLETVQVDVNNEFFMVLSRKP